MPPKKKSKKRLSKIISSFIILLSLSIVVFSLKYNSNNFLNNLSKDNNETPISLYVKNQYQKQENQTAKIAIKNGCGKKNLGLVYKRYLLDIGYDITETTNAVHVNGEYNFGHTASKIYFHKKNKESAIYLSNTLGIDQKQVLEHENLNNFHDLTLVLGQNYINLKSYKVAQTFNPFNND